MKIFRRFFARSLFHFSFDPDLALHFHPIHEQGGIWIFLELPPLLAVVISEEDKAALVEILQQDDAGGGFFVGASGQRHRVCIVNPGFDRGGEPIVELCDRVGIDRGPAQSGTTIFAVAEMSTHSTSLRANLAFG